MEQKSGLFMCRYFKRRMAFFYVFLRFRFLYILVVAAVCFRVSDPRQGDFVDIGAVTGDK